VFGHVKEGLLWNAFKQYWMGDDKKQFSPSTLLQLTSEDIETLVVLQDRGKVVPFDGAYKHQIYLFQAWYESLLNSE
jgi:hypothetical protein